MFKKYLYIFLMCLLCTCTFSEAKMLDSGIPIACDYQLEKIVKFLGQKVVVHFIKDDIKYQIILVVKGVLISNKNDTLLLGKTESKNKIIISIKTINNIEVFTER